MTDDLKVRGRANHPDRAPGWNLCNELVDRIEQLEAENDKLLDEILDILASNQKATDD